MTVRAYVNGDPNTVAGQTPTCKSLNEAFAKQLEEKGGNMQPLGSNTKATTLGGLLCFQLSTHPLGRSICFQRALFPEASRRPCFRPSLTTVNSSWLTRCPVPYYIVRAGPTLSHILSLEPGFWHIVGAQYLLMNAQMNVQIN